MAVAAAVRIDTAEIFLKCPVGQQRLGDQQRRYGGLIGGGDRRVGRLQFRAGSPSQDEAGERGGNGKAHAVLLQTDRRVRERRAGRSYTHMTTLSILPGLGLGVKRLSGTILADHADDAKADISGAEGALASSADRGTLEEERSLETTAAQHAQASLVRSGRIASLAAGETGVVLRVIPVTAPLPHVAVRIVEAEQIRPVAAHR